MNNIETNALRIAELINPNRALRTFWRDADIYKFSSYNGLMDIVFECKQSRLHTINILAVSVVFGTYDSMNEFEAIYGKSFDTKSKESFIEAIQECVIKYLELKS